MNNDNILHLFNDTYVNPPPQNIWITVMKERSNHYKDRLNIEKNSVKMLNRQLTQLDSSWAQKNQADMQNATEVIQMCQPMVDDSIRQVYT